MLELIENNQTHGYKLYHSPWIADHWQDVVRDCDAIYKELGKKSALTQYDYSLGEPFNFLYAIGGASKSFYYLFREMVEVVKLNFDIATNPVWITCWSNYQEVHEIYPKPHEHSYVAHGYVSIDPKITETKFPDYSINNKIGQIYFGPGYREHFVKVLQPFEGKRLTIGFEISDQELPIGSQFSLMPVV